MLGMDTLVARTYEKARRLEECHRTLAELHHLACVMLRLLMVVLYFSPISYVDADCNCWLRPPSRSASAGLGAHCRWRYVHFAPLSGAHIVKPWRSHYDLCEPGQPLAGSWA